MARRRNHYCEKYKPKPKKRLGIGNIAMEGMGLSEG